MNIETLQYAQIETALRDLTKYASGGIAIESSPIIEAVLRALYEASQLQERVEDATSCLMFSDISDHCNTELAYKILTHQAPLVAKLGEDAIRQYEKKQLLVLRSAYRKLEGEYQELVSSIRDLAMQAGVAVHRDEFDDDEDDEYSI